MFGAIDRLITMRLSVDTLAKTPPVPTMPPGLVELMEGLSKEVLKNNPSDEDLYQFCADHMKNLLNIRGASEGKKPLPLEIKIKRAQEKINKKAQERRKKFDEFLKQVAEENTSSLPNQSNDLSVIEVATVAYETYDTEDICNKAIIDEAESSVKEVDYSDVSEMVVKDNYENVTVATSDELEDSKLRVKRDEKCDDNAELIFRELHQEMENNAISIKEFEDELLKVDNAIPSGESFDVTSTNVVQNNVDSDMIREHDETKGKYNTEDDNYSAENGKLKKNTSSDGFPSGNIKNDTKLTESEFDESNSSLILSEKNVRDLGFSPEVSSNKNNELAIKNDASLTTSILTICDEEESNTTSPREQFSNENKLEVIEENVPILNISGLLSEESADTTEVNNEEDNFKSTDITNTQQLLEENEIVNTASENLETNASSNVMTSLNQTKTIEQLDTPAKDVSSNSKAQSTEQDTKLVSENLGAEENIQAVPFNEKSDTVITDNLIIDINAIAKSDSINEESHDNISDSTVNDIGESSDVINSGMDLETAAVTIQKVFRSFMCKSRASTLDDTTNDNISLDVAYTPQEMLINEEINLKTEDEYHASNLKERRPLGINRMDTVLQTVNEEKSLSLSDDSSMSSAATIIQAHVRGFLVRNKLHSTKTTSSNSLVNSDEVDNEPKNKTVLNIHIIPEGGHYLSRDESMAMSLDLPYDHSPPIGWGHSSSLNLHPLSERRKHLKREDAIQSISPPSNNSGKLSDDVDSLKELSVNGNETGKNALLLTNSNVSKINAESNGLMKNIKDQITDTLLHDTITVAEINNDYDKNRPKQDKSDDNDRNEIKEIIEVITPIKSDIHDTFTEVVPGKGQFHLDKSPSNTEIEPSSRDITSESVTGETVIEINKNIGQNIENSILEVEHNITNMQTDEMDVVTKDEISDKTFAPSIDFDSTPKLLHSGEFHEIVLPTSVSRGNSSVVREFTNVMVKYLLWSNSS